MDVLVGTAASVCFDLQGPTGTLPPDNSSTFSTVYATTGTVLTGPTAITTTTSMSVIPICITSGYNTITSPCRWEKRTIVLVWTSGGQSYSLRQSYRVVPFLNLTATADDVRTVMGLSDDELIDEEIDLFSAYFSVETDATKAVLDAALASGGPLELAANKAITYQAAMDRVSSLRTRLLQSQSDGVQKVTRFSALPNFEQLEQQLRAERAAAMAILIGIPVPLPTYLRVTQPRDVITDGYQWRDRDPAVIINP